MNQTEIIIDVTIVPFFLSQKTEIWLLSPLGVIRVNKGLNRQNYLVSHALKQQTK